MTVTVKLFATLRQFHPEGRAGVPMAVQLDEGATVSALVERLGVPRQAVRVAFVNGVVVDEATLLHDGDDVGFFPALAGGR